MNKKEDFETGVFYEFLNSMPLKESDKGLIITGAVFIEELLKRLLEKRLIVGKKIKENIDRLKFDVLIELSYSTGIISQEIKEDLNILRNIRNKVAHYSKTKINKKWIFTELCKLNFKRIELFEDFSKNEEIYREFYVFVINAYLMILDAGIKDISKIKKDKCLRIGEEKIE